MIWHKAEWEIKSNICEYFEGWKALYGDIDPTIIVADNTWNILNAIYSHSFLLIY